MLRSLDSEKKEYLSFKDNLTINRIKDNITFFCPNCLEKVVYVQCFDRINHFRHLSDSICVLHEPESEEHIAMKQFFCMLLSKDNINKNITTEFRIGDQIADVYYDNGIIKCVIECQCSHILTVSH